MNVSDGWLESICLKTNDFHLGPMIAFWRMEEVWLVSSAWENFNLISRGDDFWWEEKN